MADAALGLMRLMEFGAPLGVAVCEDLAERASVCERATALAEPFWSVKMVHDEHQALALMGSRHFIILDPNDEVAAVLALERARDHVLSAGSRLLLLLSKEGPGLRALADAPALASFVRGDLFFAGIRVDRHSAMAQFLESHGLPYDEWLRRWRGSELDDTFENNLVLSEALSIEAVK